MIINSCPSIGNSDLGRKWETRNKYREHQRLLIIMLHMDSKLVLQIGSTLSFSVYLNVLC